MVKTMEQMFGTVGKLEIKGPDKEIIEMIKAILAQNDQILKINAVLVKYISTVEVRLPEIKEEK